MLGEKEDGGKMQLAFAVKVTHAFLAHVRQTPDEEE